MTERHALFCLAIVVCYHVKVCFHCLCINILFNANYKSKCVYQLFFFKLLFSILHYYFFRFFLYTIETTQKKIETTTINPVHHSNGNQSKTNINVLNLNATKIKLPVSCSEEEFKCVQSNKCIPKHFRCDGPNHCDHGEDELCCTINFNFLVIFKNCNTIFFF